MEPLFQATIIFPNVPIWPTRQAWYQDVFLSETLFQRYPKEFEAQKQANEKGCPIPWSKEVTPEQAQTLVPSWGTEAQKGAVPQLTQDCQ